MIARADRFQAPFAKLMRPCRDCGARAPPVAPVRLVRALRESFTAEGLHSDERWKKWHVSGRLTEPGGCVAKQ